MLFAEYHLLPFCHCRIWPQIEGFQTSGCFTKFLKSEITAAIFIHSSTHKCFLLDSIYAATLFWAPVCFGDNIFDFAIGKRFLLQSPSKKWLTF